MVEYSTFKLRKGEAFLIYIDGTEKLKVRPQEYDESGYGHEKRETKSFNLEKGEHLI